MFFIILIIIDNAKYSAEGQVVNTVVTFYQRFFSTWLLLAKEGLGISLVSLAKKSH